MNLEEVVKNKEQLPEFARDAVQKAYDALNSLWMYYVCKSDKPNQDDTDNENTVRKGLGIPRRFKVIITEQQYPITYCEVDIYPMSYRLQEFFKGIVKDGEKFRTFKEVDEIIPREIAGILNNGNKMRVMMNGEKWLFNGIELTYEEVIP